MDIQRENPKRRNLIRSSWVIAVLLAAGLGFCHLKPPSPRVSADSLYVDSVRRGAMVVEIRGAGVLQPEQVEWIPATTDGRVERIVSEPGATVQAGAPLIELSNPEVVQAARDAELQLRAAEADLRSRQVQLQSQILTQEAVVAATRADFEEARNRARADAELAQSGLTSTLTLQASQGREKQLAVRAEVEQKRLDLARQSEGTELAAALSRLDQLRASVLLRRQRREALLVRAGRSGILQQVAVEVGTRVTAGTNLARVAVPQPLKAVVQVSQVDASQIAIGQKARIDTHQGVVEGQVSRVDPAVQNGSVTVDVRLPMQLPRGVRPDLNVDAAIEIERVGQTLSMNRPVQVAANSSISLFRLAPNGRTAKRVPVRIGRTSYNAVEILGGLQAGDRVILSDTTAFDNHEQITIHE